MERNEFYKSFWENVNRLGVRLEGKVLDLCSGNMYLSIASIYNQQQVVCYEFYDKMIKDLKENNVATVKANIREPFFPFKANSFDYTFSGGLPFRPATCPKNVMPKELEDIEMFLEKIVSEMIRVTKKQSIINSCTFLKYFPDKYSNRIQTKDKKESLIILDCAD